MVIELRMPEARAIHAMLGEHGSRWITEGIRSSALRGRAADLARFEQIATCFRKLQSVPAA